MFVSRLPFQQSSESEWPLCLNGFPRRVGAGPGGSSGEMLGKPVRDLTNVPEEIEPCVPTTGGGNWGTVSLLHEEIPRMEDIVNKERGVSKCLEGTLGMSVSQRLLFSKDLSGHMHGVWEGSLHRLSHILVPYNQDLCWELGGQECLSSPMWILQISGQDCVHCIALTGYWCWRPGNLMQEDGRSWSLQETDVERRKGPNTRLGPESSLARMSLLWL